MMIIIINIIVMRYVSLAHHSFIPPSLEPCCMNISIWYITYQHYDEKINQSLNTCIILVGVGRIYSIHGGGGQKGGGGRDIFKIQGGVG